MAFSLFVVAAAVYMLSAIPAFSSMKQSKGNFVGDLYIKLASAIPAMCDDLRELEDFLLICLVKVETEAQIIVNDPPDLSELFPSFLAAEGSSNAVTNKSLPENAKSAYDEYNKDGWNGNVPGQTAGTKAGGTYKNKDGKLPTTDSSGNPITYKEYDVNNKVAGQNRDAERFVRGSDGSVYHTNDHYGTFTKVN